MLLIDRTCLERMYVELGHVYVKPSSSVNPWIMYSSMHRDELILSTKWRERCV